MTPEEAREAVNLSLVAFGTAIGVLVLLMIITYVMRLVIRRLVREPLAPAGGETRDTTYEVSEKKLAAVMGVSLLLREAQENGPAGNEQGSSDAQKTEATER